MPLIPTTIQVLTQTKAAGTLVAGSKFPAFVSAVSSACSQYILAASIVNSTNIATGPGTGTQFGRVTGLVPNLMSMLMIAKAASQGLAGRDIRKITDAVSFGVCNAMNTVVMQGTIIGAGPGTGTGRITGLVPDVLKGLIMLQEAAVVMAGSKLPALASSIAFGVCNHITTNAIVTITDIGVVSPPPAGPVPIVAPGIGRLV